jgi:hypothetical protein
LLRRAGPAHPARAPACKAKAGGRCSPRDAAHVCPTASAAATSTAARLKRPIAQGIAVKAGGRKQKPVVWLPPSLFSTRTKHDFARPGAYKTMGMRVRAARWSRARACARAAAHSMCARWSCARACARTAALSRHARSSRMFACSFTPGLTGERAVALPEGRDFCRGRVPVRYRGRCLLWRGELRAAGTCCARREEHAPGQVYCDDAVRFQDAAVQCTPVPDGGPPRPSMTMLPAPPHDAVLVSRGR